MRFTSQVFVSRSRHVRTTCDELYPRAALLDFPKMIEQASRLPVFNPGWQLERPQMIFRSVRLPAREGQFFVRPQQRGDEP